MQRLRCLVRKEFQELRMNPRLFRLVIIAPILQLTMLGYAATTDIREVPLVVADGDRSAASRELVARFDASSNFTVVGTVTTVDEIIASASSCTPSAAGSAVATAAPAA